MFTREKGRLHLCLAAILLFLLYILQYGGFFPASGAAPILLLPALIISAMYLGEWRGAFLGLFTGVFMDAVSADSFCFNTVSLFLIGCACGLLIRLLLNNTAISAMILCGGFTFLYISARWIAFYTVRGFDGAQYHFIHYCLPSFFITFLLSIPLYFIIRKMMRIADNHYNR